MLLPLHRGLLPAPAELSVQLAAVEGRMRQLKYSEQRIQVCAWGCGGLWVCESGSGGL